MTSSSAKPIALALSGGGVRAMVFHLGVLKLLAERQLLEDVRRVSTVSGGTLLIGLLLHEASMRWPSSTEFIVSVYPRLRERLCERSMQWGAARQLLKPRNWQFALSRSNVLAVALRQEWGIREKLSDVPAVPEWSLNGTTAETGKRFRFKRDSVGDYTLGYAAPGDFPLASAIAVSAAFPGGFGPFTLDARQYSWHRRQSWTDSADAAVLAVPPHTHLRLYDGGVYDNLGLEPIFDAGRGRTKHPGEILIVSDASAPLQKGFSAFALNPWRFKRLADIIGDQARALRVRTLNHYLQGSPGRGAYIYINTPVSDDAVCSSAVFAASFPTTLRKVTEAEFDALSEHGYRVASRVENVSGVVSSESTGLGPAVSPSQPTTSSSEA
jgi:NTE family protein